MALGSTKILVQNLGQITLEKRGVTGGELGDIRRNSPGWGTRDTRRTRRLPGKVSLAGLAAHSEASGEGITRWTRGALGGFRGWLSASVLGDTCRALKA